MHDDGETMHDGEIRGRSENGLRERRPSPSRRVSLTIAGLAGVLALGAACTPVEATSGSAAVTGQSSTLQPATDELADGRADDSITATTAATPSTTDTLPPTTDGSTSTSTSEPTTTSTTEPTTSTTEPTTSTTDSDSTLLPAEVVSIPDAIAGGFDPSAGCSFVDNALDDVTILIDLDDQGYLLIDGQPVLVSPIDPASPSDRPVADAYVGELGEDSWIVQFGDLGEAEAIGIGESFSWSATVTVNEYLHAGRSYVATGTLSCGP